MGGEKAKQSSGDAHMLPIEGVLVRLNVDRSVLTVIVWVLLKPKAVGQSRAAVKPSS